jgi:hypothetical protein
MNPLSVNSKTGFIESDGVNGFTSERKIQFLELAKDFKTQGKFPKVSMICDALGIHARTFERHLESDEVFREAWKEIATHIEYQCISDMSDLRTKNPMYMFGLLRYLNPQRWNPSENRTAPVGNVSIYLNNAKQVSEFRDAEIVDNTPAISPQSIDSPTIKPTAS